MNNKRKGSSVSGLLTILLGTPLCLIALAAFTSEDYRSYSLGFFMSSTEGIVKDTGVRKNIERSNRQIGLRQDHFDPIVSYSYSVKDQSYIGQKAAMFGSRYLSEAEAQRIVMRYFPGQKVRVFFDPKNPSNAILDTAFPWSLVAGGAINGVGLSILLLVAYVARRGHEGKKQ